MPLGFHIDGFRFRLSDNAIWGYCAENPALGGAGWCGKRANHKLTAL
jgi:hypothetical protein